MASKYVMKSKVRYDEKRVMTSKVHHMIALWLYVNVSDIYV